MVVAAGDGAMLLEVRTGQCPAGADRPARRPRRVRPRGERPPRLAVTGRSRSWSAPGACRRAGWRTALRTTAASVMAGAWSGWGIDASACCAERAAPAVASADAPALVAHAGEEVGGEGVSWSASVLHRVEDLGEHLGDGVVGISVVAQQRAGVRTRTAFVAGVELTVVHGGRHRSRASARHRRRPHPGPRHARQSSSPAPFASSRSAPAGTGAASAGPTRRTAGGHTSFRGATTTRCPALQKRLAADAGRARCRAVHARAKPRARPAGASPEQRVGLVPRR